MGAALSLWDSCRAPAQQAPLEESRLLALPPELLEHTLSFARCSGDGPWRAACSALRRALPEERALLERLPVASTARSKLLAALRAPRRDADGFAPLCRAIAQPLDLTFDEFRSVRAARPWELAPRATVVVRTDEQAREARDAGLLLRVEKGVSVSTLEEVAPSVRAIGSSAFARNSSPIDFSSFGALESIGNSAFNCVSVTVDVSALTRLQIVGISAFESVPSVVGLERCVALEVVAQRAFFSARGTIDFSGMTRLTSVRWAAFFMLESAIGLEQCARLERIDTSAFYLLRTPVDFSKMPLLEVIGRSAFASLAAPTAPHAPRPECWVMDGAFGSAL